MEPVVVELGTALHACAARRHALDAQLRIARERVLFPQDLPGEIHRFRHDLAQIAHAQRNGDDARSLSLARRAQNNIYDSGNNTELVHALAYSSSSSSNRLRRPSFKPALPSRFTMTTRVTASAISYRASMAAYIYAMVTGEASGVTQPATTSSTT